jgi:adenylate kinase family enzyme
VQVLLNALISNPSKQYLIDGFPRALDQALHFETMGCECQSVLHFKVNDEVALERGLLDASDREDNSEEAIKARITTYNQETAPVIDFYSKFGKVHEINANCDVNDVYAATRKAVLP